MNSGMDLNRRNFLTHGACATIAGCLLGTNNVSSQIMKASLPHRSNDRIIGCYVSTKEILEDPKYIDILQKKLGVNVLLSGGSIRMPDWLKALQPLKGQYSMYVLHTDDDSELVRAIEETHRRGMKFWLYYSGHHNNKDERHVMAETFEGVKFADLPRIPYAITQDEYTTCFAKPSVKAYENELFSYSAVTYGVDKMYVSHTRYSTPSFWSNLFGCACDYCQQSAYDMGYNFEKMKNSMQNLLRSLKNLDKKTIDNAAQSRPIFSDFLVELGEDDGVMDWLYFRAKVVGNALSRIHDSIHAATNDKSGFVTDTHGATMALYVGHNYEDLIGGGSDGLHPLSWCEAQYIAVIASWANQLCTWVPGLDESTALRVVISFFGWDEIGLPDKKIADLGIPGNSADFKLFDDPTKGFYGYFNPHLTIKLMTHEWTKLAMINHGRVPVHPVIKGFEWPEKVCRELMAKTEDLGFEGYIFQRTDTLINRSKL